MSIDRADVEKIAHLARLAIDDQEAERFAKDLSAILDLVEQMNAADTEAVEPLAHPLRMAQRLRADAVTEPDQRDKCQRIAPLTEDGLYLVPKVID
jgi:aspartyl-tRNA(Asn)/glutamyl-tRNA(Gln) amidotransferase subunit C